MRALMRDPQARVGARLARALARLGGETMRIEMMRLNPWASATFSGARHEVRLRFDSSAAARAFAEALPDADLPLTHAFVADAVARVDAADPCRVDAKILTLEEG